jgi:hypothetical protein
MPPEFYRRSMLKGGGSLCSPTRGRRGDRGERGSILGQPAGGRNAEPATTHAAAGSARVSFRATVCSAYAGAEVCAVPLHGEGPDQ